MAPTSTESMPEMFTGRDQPVLRCAVYTRQSVAPSEQDLTSCDVQRETCENYVREDTALNLFELDLPRHGERGQRPAVRLRRPQLDVRDVSQE